MQPHERTAAAAHRVMQTVGAHELLDAVKVIDMAPPHLIEGGLLPPCERCGEHRWRCGRLGCV